MPSNATGHSLSPRLGLLQGLRQLPNPAWFLLVGAFINRFGGFVLPFFTVYLTRQGFSAGQAGLAMSAYGVGSLAASLIGGWLADHIGRRRTIVLSMVGGAGMMMGLSQAASFPMILLMSGLVGLAGECYRPACSALLADLVPPENRVTAFAAFRLAINAGFAFGPATAGFLSNRSYFWLFAGDALTSLLFGVVAWFLLPSDKPESRLGSDWRKEWLEVARDSRLHRLLTANFCVGLVFFQTTSTFALHTRDSGLSGSDYGLLLSFNGVIVVFCELALTSVVLRLPTAAVMGTGYLLTGCGFALTGWFDTMPALAGVVACFTLGEMLGSPTSMAHMANLAPQHLRGRYMGVFGLTWAAALIVGSALFTRLYEFSPNSEVER